MKRKYINAIEWGFLESYKCSVKKVEKPYDGFVSYVDIEKVKRKLTVDYDDSETVLIDDGYKCVLFLPIHEKWCLSAVFNREHELIEWYFDMTAGNGIDEKGNPFYDDLYLDLAVRPDFTYAVLDEDELQEALDKEIITIDDYNLAYETCSMIKEEIITDREFMVNFFRDISKEFGSEKRAG